MLLVGVDDGCVVVGVVVVFVVFFFFFVVVEVAASCATLASVVESGGWTVVDKCVVVVALGAATTRGMAKSQLSTCKETMFKVVNGWYGAKSQKQLQEKQEAGFMYGTDLFRTCQCRTHCSSSDVRVFPSCMSQTRSMVKDMAQVIPL